ncbi:MAG TPA: hypothetical protein PLB92_07160 [Rhodoglobus sp.]|nr:hypothetical protein [Rhodoglobus sp.]
MPVESPADFELLAGFDAGTLPRFPHDDHVRVVYLMVLEGGEQDALARVTAGIRAMAAANGKPEAFHATRTTAWTRVIADRTAKGSWADSHRFLAANPDLLRRDLLSDFYSDALLTSDAARLAFVEPDLAPLP